MTGKLLRALSLTVTRALPTPSPTTTSAIEILGAAAAEAGVQAITEPRTIAAAQAAPRADPARAGGSVQRRSPASQPR